MESQFHFGLPDFLFVAHPLALDEHFRRAIFTVHAFLDENRLDCSITKHHSGREKTIEHSDSNLHYRKFSTPGPRQVEWLVLTYALRFGHFECPNRLFLGFWRNWRCDRIQRHLAVLRSRRRRSPNVFVGAHGADSLQRHGDLRRREKIRGLVLAYKASHLKQLHSQKVQNRKQIPTVLNDNVIESVRVRVRVTSAVLHRELSSLNRRGNANGGGDDHLVESLNLAAKELTCSCFS